MDKRLRERKDRTSGRTPGWREDAGITQAEAIDNLQHPLGDASPDFLDEKTLNFLTKIIGHGWANDQGLWNRLDLNVGWILQELKDENPELATKLADDFQRFSNTLWIDVLRYNWPPEVYRYGLPEEATDS